MDGFSTKSKCSGSTLIVAKRTSRLSNAIMHRSSPCAIVARFKPFDRKSPSTFISLKYDKLVHSTFNQAKFTLIADLPIYYQPRGKLSSQKCSTIITHTSRWLETDLFELFSTLKWLSLYLQGSELSSQQQAEVAKSGSNHQRLSHQAGLEIRPALLQQV